LSSERRYNDPAVGSAAAGCIEFQGLCRSFCASAVHGLQETDLTTTSEAQRVAAPERARIWKIKNPAVTNPVSKSPVAYKVQLDAATA
jgi:Cu2+-containing amine oxidase